MEGSVGLAHTIACGYPTLEHDDAVQEALIGFLRAAQTFAPERARWSTYAAIWGRQRCWRAVQNTTGCIRTPIHAWSRRDLRLDIYIDIWEPPSSDSKWPLESRLPSSFPSPEVAVEAEEQAVRMRCKIRTLPPRLQRVIVGRYYEDKTLEEVGRELGVTRERVRQLEVQAFKLLRRRMEALHAG